MKEQLAKEMFKRKRGRTSYQLMLDYANYIKQRKLATNQKILFDYRGVKLAFTPKQLTVLNLVAKGFSNCKIAQLLLMKESTVKLLIYRLMKYMEAVLYDKIDRFYIVIIAQQLGLKDE